MDKIDAFGFGIIGLIAVIGLLTVSCVAIKYENRTIEQAENLSVLCAKVYKSEFKDDGEIKELCKNVEVRIGEL